MNADTTVAPVEGTFRKAARHPIRLQWETVLTVIFLLIGGLLAMLVRIQLAPG